MKTELVTTLKRKATEVIAALQDSRDPVLITEHGKPAAVLVDVATFEEMNRRISILEGLALGERAISEGNAITHEQAKTRLGKWLQ